MGQRGYLLVLLGLVDAILLATYVIAKNAGGLLVDFVVFYAAVSFAYLSYRYFFGIINYPLHHMRYGRILYTPKVSIVIPCYNEEKKYLIDCIKSACTVDYPKKEIIVVDDGSSDKESWKTILELRKIYNFKTIKFEKNKGKRSAMAAGFKESTGEAVITMDSDSIIPSGNAIRELVKPLVDRQVGAVSGCVLVGNANNLMTKMQEARYWMAFYIEKSSQNPYNSVTCASGPFSAYRREYLMKFADEWENQVFLGQKCTYGDDRGLTTFMLKNGYNVKFARDAIMYTNVPETFGKLVKQQVRWKKSFIRENWYLLKFILEKNFFMNLEFFLFWTVFLTGFIAKLLTIYLFAVGQIPVAAYAAMLLFVTFLHYIYVFIKSPGKRGYFGAMYGIFNEFLLTWLFFYAIATLRDSKWGTR